MNPIDRRPRAGRLFASLALVAGTLGLAGCATNPATGESQLSFIGTDSEIQMGREADQQVVASMGLYPDESMQRYVQNLGEQLAAASERPELPWTFRVIDDPTVNAFALPGGFIYITRGIMSHLTSEAQLVGILGHEIGHVTARHSVNQMSKAQLAQIGLGVGMIFSPQLRALGDVAGAGLQLMFLKFGRDDEREADMLGVRYMRRLDYDPRQLASVMGMLDATSQLQQGSGRVPEWLSTHPDPGNRVQDILGMVSEAGEDLSSATVRRAEYLRRLDGMTFGDDPREGFFDDGVFHHPELRFRIDFPQGWRGINTKTAVQVVAPDEDAVMILQLAQGTPTQAYQQFRAQEGVRVLDARERTVNGKPAVIAAFAAQTQQGTLTGEVLWLTHGGTTYQLLGFAPESRWSRYRGVVEQALVSFRDETDPSVLNVQPDRLDLVRLDRTLSLQAFVERYPSEVRPEIVALINQVLGDGTLEGGHLWKRVVDGVR